MFLMDNSDLVTAKQYETQLLLVTNMVEKLYNEGSRFVVVSFNDEAHVHISFQHQANKTQLQNSVSKIPHNLYIINAFCFYHVSANEYMN